MVFGVLSAQCVVAESGFTGVTSVPLGKTGRRGNSRRGLQRGSQSLGLTKSRRV